MNIRTAAALWAAVVVVGQPLVAQPNVDDYEHAIGLRSAWADLTENIAEPAQWIEGTHRFVYRKTVPGGFKFVVMDAETKEKQPAFDHDRLATALGTATGKVFSALRLPFTEPFASVEISDSGRALTTEFDEDSWKCSLTDYVCSRLPPHGGHQPRGFETVRDLKIPADNSPKKSPDGHWLAFVQNWNIAVRASSGGEVVLLSSDGSEGEFYDPESIAWSPDSKKLAAYRVRPGFRREVTRVISSPPDQVQPKVAVQFYPKPGDAVDIDRPVIFHIDTKAQLRVPFDQFPNPYTMSPLTWRKDSRSVTFEYDQRGHQVYDLFEVNADSAAVRIVATDRTTTFINIGRRFTHDVGGMGLEIIWMSERDGWNHLYLYDGRTGRVKNQITRGEWVVRDVVKVDDEKRQIWFAASGMRKNEDPYLQHYYRIDFDGQHLTPLTTASAYHDVTFSSDMNYYVDTYSRIDLAQHRRAASHRRRRAACRSRTRRYQQAGGRGLQSPRGVRRQGPRRKDRHLGSHSKTSEFRSGQEISGHREHLRRTACLLRAQDLLAVRTTLRRRQGPRHAVVGGYGFYRGANRWHGHAQPLKGFSRRRLEEPRGRRTSRPHSLAPGGRCKISVLRHQSGRYLWRFSGRSKRLERARVPSGIL